MEFERQEKSVLSVSELTRQVKLSLENRFPRVWVQGEISNLKIHTSGHMYFTVKDEGAQLSATMWRNRVANLLFQPEDGMKVIARGGITVYPPRGSYQIDVEQLQPMGIGELQLAFERLKKKLAAEGLFAEEHKKPIPEYPDRLGIVTSETGAALQDIRSVIERRMPSLEVTLASVRVQGVGAAEEIADAIRQFNRQGNVDVLIVGRGGGSLEDLWAFNEEIVARAIFDSRIPVISAVGHEIDFSIADFVADLRAPTPSAAAELVTRDRRELLDVLRNFCYTIEEQVRQRIDSSRETIRSLVGSYSFNRPRDLVREYSQRVDELERGVRTNAAHSMQMTGHRLVTADHRLEALAPANVLKRGYAMVKKGEAYISHAKLLKPGDEATIRFHDGSVATTVRQKQ